MARHIHLYIGKTADKKHVVANCGCGGHDSSGAALEPDVKKKKKKRKRPALEGGPLTSGMTQTSK